MWARTRFVTFIAPPERHGAVSIGILTLIGTVMAVINTGLLIGVMTAVVTTTIASIYTVMAIVIALHDVVMAP